MHKLKLTINPTYSQLVPPLTDTEYLDLKNSIAEHGQYHDIIVNKNNVVLDGHNRLKVLNELHLKPKVLIKKFDNPQLEQLFVINTNLQRRHLNSWQKGILILKKKPIYEEIAKSNMSLGGKFKDGNKLTPLSRVNDKLGNEVGLSHETIRKISFIQSKVSTADIEKLNSGQKSVNEVYKTIKNEETRQELINSKPAIDLPNGCKLYQGDCFEVSKKIPDNSISLAFCDPPYSNEKQSIEIFGNLGHLAQRVLKQGGALVTYIGRQALPEFLNAILESGLKFWWLLAIHHQGQHSRLYQKKIFVRWKPICVFVKGTKIADHVRSFSDYIESTPTTKTLHRYQQSTTEAEYIIKNLTLKNQTIFDPFMGSGTSGIAALTLQRQYIGIEQDKQIFKIATNRIKNFVSNFG